MAEETEKQESKIKVEDLAKQEEELTAEEEKEVKGGIVDAADYVVWRKNYGRSGE